LKVCWKKKALENKEWSSGIIEFMCNDTFPVILSYNVNTRMLCIRYNYLVRIEWMSPITNNIKLMPMRMANYYHRIVRHRAIEDKRDKRIAKNNNNNNTIADEPHWPQSDVLDIEFANKFNKNKDGDRLLFAKSHLFQKQYFVLSCSFIAVVRGNFYLLDLWICSNHLWLL